MEDDSKSKAQLALAFELYSKGDYAQSRKYSKSNSGFWDK